jgi:hypothetical protein
MRAFRAICLVIFALLAILPISNLLNPTPNTNIPLQWSALFIFGGFVLILGPFWPNAQRIQTFKSLVADVLGVRDATKIIAFTIGALGAFFLAWDRYIDPAQDIHSLERIIVLAVGRSALPIVEAIFGMYFLWRALDEYAKARRSGKEAA